MAANAGRYPVSAQCEILGAPRSTYYAMRGRAEPAEAPDPAAEEVAAAFEESRGRYGPGRSRRPSPAWASCSAGAASAAS